MKYKVMDCVLMKYENEIELTRTKDLVDDTRPCNNKHCCYSKVDLKRIKQARSSAPILEIIGKSKDYPSSRTFLTVSSKKNTNPLTLKIF